MRHVVIGGKSVLMGESAAELLMQYATLLSQQHTADAVELTVYDSTGAETQLTVVLNDGAPLASEHVPGDMAEPDNRKAEELLRTRISALLRKQEPPAEDIAGAAYWNGPGMD